MDIAKKYQRYLIPCSNKVVKDENGNKRNLPFRTEDIYCYNIENGIISLTNELGFLFITPYSAEMEIELKRCFYTYDRSLEVPLSSHEMFEDQYLQQTFQFLLSLKK